ncbi:hypothetical protein CROQUDRAFT_714180 [Cronartium quercuum f. sp. fusiforme G11]|uniref:Uncharacterized protein n=1 Tax=Cronartium quercuum f. sp. fusiforme G11 TaxID=708437 RepID=A0A9P6TFQ8_9BASI|nr:hypothetical protein CROQUDRAFT_714180 [Cronartium quercuum f. sp. fusiforme G11]
MSRMRTLDPHWLGRWQIQMDIRNEEPTKSNGGKTIISGNFYFWKVKGSPGLTLEFSIQSKKFDVLEKVLVIPHMPSVNERVNLTVDNFIESELQRFIAKIPFDTNPYQATADFLTELIVQPPVVPTWAKAIDRWVVFADVVLLAQACYLLYLRIKTRRLKFFAMNTIGLIKVEVINVCTVNSLLYSALTVVDRVWREAIWTGSANQSWQIGLFGTKFIPLLLWSWYVQTFVGMRFQVLTQTRRNRKRNPTKPPSASAYVMAWIMNGYFVTMLVLPVCLVTWAMYGANYEYMKYTKIVININKTLVHLAPSYSPGTYNPYQLVSTLLPVERITSHYDSLRYYIRVVLATYLTSITILVSSYIPVIGFVFTVLFGDRTMRNLSQEEDLKSPTSGKTEIPRTLLQQRKMVMWHTILVYIGTLGFVPVVIWATIGNVENQGFWLDGRWWNGLEAGLHAPVAVVGNACLFLLYYIDYGPGSNQRYEETLVVALAENDQQI